jgi:hypothetical protein
VWEIAMRRSVKALFAIFLASILSTNASAATKTHTVVLGAAHKVAYSKAGDPSGAATDESELKIRALLVDGVLKEWTTGDAHDVTDRSFAVRRVIKLNDTLPGDKAAATGHWVWQRGPWVLVDRATGKVSAIKLPDYDPGVSQVTWFRDFAAYCGLTPSGKSLYAVVMQVGAKKASISRKLAAFDPGKASNPACAPAEWQREPLRVTFHPAGQEAASFDVAAGSAVLVEDAGDETEK